VGYSVVVLFNGTPGLSIVSVFKSEVVQEGFFFVGGGSLTL